MARDKVELLVQLVGKDGVTKILDSAATEALRLDENLRRGQKSSKGLSRSVSGLGDSWAAMATGANQSLELIMKIGAAVADSYERVKETVRARQVEAQFVKEISYSVERLSEASGFQMTDLELKKFALQAKNAGLSMEQFEQILRVSLQASAGTGREFNEVFEGITDTVIGATDSYLEQLGIVADVGTITEKYAKKLGIAKDQIDKTKQSQAMLNYVLVEVQKRFDGVTVDKFASELSKAERDLKNFADEMRKAELFFFKDVFEFVTGTGGRESAFQVFKDGQKEVAKLSAELQKYGEGTDAYNKKQAVLNEKMRALGEIAKQDATVMMELGAIIRETAQDDQSTAQFTNAAQAAERLNRKIMQLANAYGIANTAQNSLTTGARALQRSMVNTQRVAEQTAQALADLESFQRGRGTTYVDTGEDLPAPEGRDAETDAGIAKLNEERKKKKKKRRRRGGGGSKIQKTEKDVEKRYKAVLNRYQRTSEVQQKILKTEMTIREQLEALDTEVAFGIGFFGEVGNTLGEKASEWVNKWQEFTQSEDLKEWAEKNWDWVDPAAIRLKELSIAMEGLNSAAKGTDEALSMLGANPGFSAVVENSGKMVEASINFANVNKKSAKDYVKLSDTIVSAAGQGALGFIEGEKARAGVLAAMEYAHGSAALATAIMTQAPNAYVASAMHFVNAGLYTAIASGAKVGKSGGGGASASAAGASASGGARRLPSFGQQSGVNQQMQPAQVVVNMSGAIVAGANRQKTANDLGQLVQESMAGTR